MPNIFSMNFDESYTENFAAEGGTKIPVETTWIAWWERISPKSRKQFRSHETAQYWERKVDLCLAKDSVDDDDVVGYMAKKPQHFFAFCFCFASGVPSCAHSKSRFPTHQSSECRCHFQKFCSHLCSKHPVSKFELQTRSSLNLFVVNSNEGFPSAGSE